MAGALNVGQVNKEKAVNDIEDPWVLGLGGSVGVCVHTYTVTLSNLLCNMNTEGDFLISCLTIRPGGILLLISFSQLHGCPHWALYITIVVHIRSRA